MPGEAVKRLAETPPARVRCTLTASASAAEIDWHVPAADWPACAVAAAEPFAAVVAGVVAATLASVAGVATLTAAASSG